MTGSWIQAELMHYLTEYHGFDSDMPPNLVMDKKDTIGFLARLVSPDVTA